MERTGGFGRVIMPHENKRTKKIFELNMLKGQRRALTQVFYSVAGLLCGCGSVLTGLNPMAMGWMTAFLLKGGEFYSILCLTVVGFFVSYNSINTPRYIITAILMFGANIILTGTLKTKKQRFLTGMLCTAAGGTIIAVISGMSAYIMFKTVVESIMTFIFAMILNKAVEVVDSGLERTILTEEECISIVVLFVCMLLGGNNITFMNASIKGILAYCLIFIMAYRGGIAVGGVSGCIVGVLLMTGGQALASMVCVLCICGIAGGAVSSFPRLPYAVFVMSAAIFAGFYIDKEMLTISFIITLGLGALLFLAVPRKTLGFVNTFSGNREAEKETEYFLRLKMAMVDKLLDFSGTFSGLAKVFEDKTADSSRSEVMVITEKIRLKVCDKCAVKEFCWKRDLYSTYQAVIDFVSICGRRGALTYNDADKGFNKRCSHVEEFVQGFNEIYKQEKNAKYWNRKIEENKDIIRRQIVSTGELIEGLSAEIKAIGSFDGESERSIKAGLEKNKIESGEIGVLINAGGKYKVTIAGINEHNILRAADIAGSVIGSRLTEEKRESIPDSEGIKLYLTERPKYNITAAVAGVPKDGEQVSGDSHCYREFTKGFFVMALADGMGCGRRAQIESKTAVELLEQFIEAGFKNTFAVKLINSVMFLRSTGERFSTLDLFSLDLYTGKGEFIKTGATSAYICGKNGVKSVRSSALPIGILDNIDIDPVRFRLKDGDMVVMLTDGAADIIEKLGGSLWIENIVNEMKCKNPETISQYILGRVRSEAGGKAEDDMTVMTAVFWSGV